MNTRNQSHLSIYMLHRRDYHFTWFFQLFCNITPQSHVYGPAPLPFGRGTWVADSC